MSRPQKSNTLYPHPFSKAYWRDAAMELKDTKMLVFAALMIALRVALKLVAIPLAPNLKINTAFLANALGAMVFGPVMAGLSAIVSDVLGVLITGDAYFPPFVLTEIAGSMIFAMFLYRARLTPTRVMLSRFCICLFVNILLQTPIMMLYYRVMMGGKTFSLTVPSILKNLFMFPIESVVLTLFLSVIQPITCRLGLTRQGEHMLQFSKKQIVLLVSLFIFGTGCVFGYLTYHYQHTSLTTGYSAQERVEKNKAMDAIVEENIEGYDGDTVSIIESSYKDFMGKEVTYYVAYYAVKDGVEPDQAEALWGLKKTPARKSEDLQVIGSAEILMNEKSGEVLSFSYTPAEAAE